MTRIDDVKRTVAAIDATRTSEHFRNSDRPDGRAVRRRKALHPEVIRAQARVRVSAWRNRQDAAGIPTTAQIGMALVASLASARQSELTAEDRGLVGRALVSLQQRGFSVVAAKEVLARLRDRIADPAENVDSGAPGQPSSSAF